MRITSAVERKSKVKKLLSFAKGFYGRKKNCLRIAKPAVMRSLASSYKDRKTRKRNMRSLWIMRINAGLREMGLKYSTFINQMKVKGIEINRKSLSEISSYSPEVFKEIVLKIVN